MPSLARAGINETQMTNVCFIPDEQLSQAVISTSGANAEDVNRLQAEVFFRRWLYRGSCPDSIKLAVDSLKGAHPDLHDFVVNMLCVVQATPVLKDVFDEESAFEKRAAKLSADKVQLAKSDVEAILKARVLSFRKAHGVIPLSFGEDGPVFPIPFQITGSRRGGVCCADRFGKPIPSWNEHLAPLLERLDSSQGIRILCDLSDADTAIRFEGNGFLLAVALASYNLEHFAEINPLNVLVTGALDDGLARSGRASLAKVDLARRMGVSLWVQTGPCDQNANGSRSVLAIAEGQSLTQALDEIRRKLAEVGMARGTARHAREIIARHYHLPPSSGASIKTAIGSIEYNIKVLKDEDNEYLLPSIADGYILLASLHNHAGDAKTASKILNDIESLLKGDRVRLCKLYAHKVVALTDLGNLREAETLGRKARAVAQQLDILVPGQAEALIETTGSLGGEAVLHKALRSGDLRDSDECYGLLSRTLDIAEELARAGYRTQYVDADLWHAKSAARFVLWHAFFDPTKISDRVAEAVDAVRSPIQAGKFDVSEEYLKRTQFLGGYRALLAGKPPVESAFSRWELPCIKRGAPEWVQATALKYRGALRAHFKLSGAAQDFEQAAELLKASSAPVIRLIFWSVAVQAKLSGCSTSIHEAALEDGIADAVDYLSWDPAAASLVDRLIQGNYQNDDLTKFQTWFPY